MNEDKATRYHRLSRRAAVLAVVVTGGYFAALLTGPSLILRELSDRATAGLTASIAPLASVALFVVLLTLLYEALTLPLAYYRGHLLERRYGMSVQTRARWLADHLKAAGVELAFGLVVAEIVYAAMRRSPEWWWALTAAVLSLLMIAIVRLAPVLLMPLFYRFTPLQRDPLRDRLMALASRVGTRVIGAYEWKLSDRTRRANAALTGLGSTRRIILSDTLLAEYSDDEIEVILAHELAHHLHRDIWTGMAYQTALVFLGLYAAHAALTAIGPLVGVDRLADLAGLPIVVLAAGLVSFVLVPAANALSRAHEYRADRFALDVTRNPGAFISAMKRLGAQNLAEERPSRLVEVLFHTHPPLSRRIAAAQRWSAADSQP